MSALVSPSAKHRLYLRHGFQWTAAEAYLFDIDGTLLNCRDPVHYQAFRQATRQVLGIEPSLDGLQLHGNTDIGILRAALAREGLADAAFDAHLPHIVELMCAEVLRNREHLLAEACLSIRDLLVFLLDRGKLLGAASGNLEPIGWLKLEKAGLKSLLSFGAFAWPRESRAEIFRHGITLARQRLGHQASVYIVGDTPADIQAAKIVEAPVIAVATGIYSFSDLVACAPDACFASASDLLSLPDDKTDANIARRSVL
jgi:phosphoglycolate phosphatase-like HAD superfamily hydrolase